MCMYNILKFFMYMILAMNPHGITRTVEFTSRRPPFIDDSTIATLAHVTHMQYTHTIVH